MDEVNRYPDIPEDKVYPVTTVEEAMSLLNAYIDKYDTRHGGIKF